MGEKTSRKADRWKLGDGEKVGTGHLKSPKIQMDTQREMKNAAKERDKFKG